MTTQTIVRKSSSISFGIAGKIRAVLGYMGLKANEFYDLVVWARESAEIEEKYFGYRVTRDLDRER
ncbi:MAG: hypothetical protein O2826_03955 [Chloroflexi bacterium]|nr:hypothetical protein [Chloroflexota bacterium]MDA1173657.1 hypothetical protein [Chloroflexota bacterium]